MLLRRAVTRLLCSRQFAAAAATGGVHPLPPAATAAWQSMRGFGGGAGDAERLNQQTQPLSVAMKQLEEAVTEAALPANALAANRKALATLKQFTASLSGLTSSYPPASVKNVQFVFRDPYSEGRLQPVRCQLKTTGGNCAALVQQTLGQLLQRLGLSPYFYFDRDEFQVKAPPKPRVLPKPPRTAPARAAPPTGDEVAAVRARAAAAGFPSQPVSEEQFREMEQQSASARENKSEVAAQQAETVEKMKKMDPLLAAVAAVPWLAKSASHDDRERAQMIRTRVVDELESCDWDVRGPIRRIWEGSRELQPLLAGKDAGSQLVIKAILFHAALHDKKYGRATFAT